jgi:hypothetical protein
MFDKIDIHGAPAVRILHPAIMSILTRVRSELHPEVRESQRRFPGNVQKAVGNKDSWIPRRSSESLRSRRHNSATLRPTLLQIKT